MNNSTYGLAAEFEELEGHEGLAALPPVEAEQLVGRVVVR